MAIRDGDLPAICTSCTPHHAENCATCFGWGLKRGAVVNGRPVPIIATETDGRDPLPPWERCPECGGTPFGIEADAAIVAAKSEPPPVSRR